MSDTPIRLETVGALVVSAAEAAGIGVVLLAVDEAPRTLFVNEVFARWIGQPADAIVLRPAFDFLAPEDRSAVAGYYAARAKNDGTVPTSLECSLLTQSGERIPVAVGVARSEVRDKAVQIVLFTDMRDRKAVAAKLSASERRFRDLLQAAPDGVVISQRLAIRYANRAADAMLGVAPGGLIGRSLAEFLPQPELERMQARLGAMAAGESLPPAVYRATRPDGVEVLAEIASIFTEHEGQPAVLAVARDVTDREALNANLERTERLAALGRLSAGMAHEINNPLAFVSLSAEALERRLRTLDVTPAQRDEISALLDNIARGTTRVAAIVRDLKAFSRDGDTERGPTDLDQVLGSAIRMVQHEIAPRAVLVRETEATPLVVGGQRKLEQVFVNLLMNAIQALPEDRMGRVTVRTSVEADAAVVSISDDGVGIARAHLDRVFDPFFTTKPVGVGTGLGLSICHGIVTALGGTISIDSEEGRGTTVHVRLLRSIPAERVEPRPAAAPAPPPKIERHHVLVIEDQLPLARTLSRALAYRYEVTLAATVAEGLAAIQRDHVRFDAILCDMLLPDGTGIDVFEGARARHAELASRFVFMTGGAFLPSLAEFLDRSPNPRIDKPFGLPALEELLDRVVGATPPFSPS